MAGCYRHCRRDHAHRRAAGKPRSSLFSAQARTKCSVRQRKDRMQKPKQYNRISWRQPGAYAQPVRGQLRGRRQPATVLRGTLCDPRLSGGRRGVEGGGRVLPALSAPRPSPWSRCRAILIKLGLLGIPRPGMVLTRGKAIPPIWNQIEWPRLVEVSLTATA